jgi:hypothetical protein
MKPALLQSFRSSRIFAGGWNAARTSLLDIAQADKNPYPPGPEHQRWSEGFAQAQSR